MFETPLAVAVALRRYGDVFDPKTGSVIGVSRSGRGWTGDPFRPGFLGAVDERAELARRMASRLQPRERLLLVLWYVSDLQPTVIARQLNVSRVHCYRLRNKALLNLCDAQAAPGALDSSNESSEGSTSVAADRPAWGTEAGNARLAVASSGSASAGPS